MIEQPQATANLFPAGLASVNMKTLPSSNGNQEKESSSSDMQPNLQIQSNTQQQQPAPQTQPNFNNQQEKIGAQQQVKTADLPPNLMEMLEKGLLIAMSPLEISKAISTLGLDLLMIDFRPESSFSQYSLKNSINPSPLPSLVTRRFKKKIGLGNFKLEGFLASERDKKRFLKWTGSPSSDENQRLDEAMPIDLPQTKRKCILVFDENMQNYESDAWLYVGALCDGMATEISQDKSQPAPIVSFMFGGVDAFIRSFQESVIAQFLNAGYRLPSINNTVQQQNSPASSEKVLANAFLETAKISNSPQQQDKSNDSSPASAASTTSNQRTGGTANGNPPPTIAKTGRSLSIDITAKKESFRKPPPSLNLSLSTKKEATPASNHASSLSDGGVVELKSPVSSASPNDNAAPPEPYSRITKNLMVGSDVLPLSPQGPELLSNLGVTHILNMAAEIQNSKLIEDCGLFKLKWIPVYDNTEVDLDDALQQAIDFIGSAISSNPSAIVFVHCKAGRSRSVSAVIGYLVSREKHTLKTAYELVRKTRKGVSPNLGFMASLLKVEQQVNPNAATHGF